MGQMRSRHGKRVITSQIGRWLAPSSGGYSGLGPNGEVVTRRGTPPKIPATAKGVQEMDDMGQTRGEGEPSHPLNVGDIVHYYSYGTPGGERLGSVRPW